MVEDSQETESLTSIEDDSLQFSSAQIEYLKTEFERQRRWIGTLSAREKSALEELEAISN